MEQLILSLVEDLHLVFLFVIIAGTLVILVKGADLLVDEAVTLSVSWGVPKMLIGATIVSIGTTLPETAVSVFAALKGAPGLAMGNAVGSIICDTGLILGVATLIGTVPIQKKMVERQSWIQLASAVLLIVASLPFLAFSNIFSEGGRLPQVVGIGFLVLLAVYLWRSVAWSRNTPMDIEDATVDVHEERNPIVALLKLLGGIALVIIASQILIPTVEVTAHRLNIPEAIIAATLVAFGTSLPELVTAITAVRKGHGELAIGNVLGADVLNVLFVSGAAAAVTRGGLEVPPQFFYLFFPSMLFVVLVLRISIGFSKDRLSKATGVVLLLAYLITVVAGYVVPGGAPAASVGM